MKRLVLSPSAKSDLDDIWTFTVQRWSSRQAADYVALIGRACDRLLFDPSQGRSCDLIRPGYHRLKAGSHIIFYRLQQQDIEVMRILHQRMDFDLHL